MRLAGLGTLTVLFTLVGPTWANGPSQDVARLIRELERDLQEPQTDYFGSENKPARELGKLGPKAKAAIPALSKALRHHKLQAEAAFALAKIGRAAVPALINALHDSDTSVRYQATHALGIIGPPAKPAVKFLLIALPRENSEQRAKIIGALGKIGPVNRKVVPTLIELLNDKDVRADAAEALGNIGSKAKPAVPLLLKALKKREWGYRAEAAAALGKIGPVNKKVEPALARALRDKNSFVRAFAAEGLYYIGPAARRAIPALVTALTDSVPVRRNASPEEAYITDLYNHECRCTAILVLMHLGRPAQVALPKLKRLARQSQDDEIRKLARKAVKKLAKHSVRTRCGGRVTKKRTSRWDGKRAGGL